MNPDQIDQLLRDWWAGQHSSALPSEETLHLIVRFALFVLDSQNTIHVDDPLN